MFTAALFSVANFAQAQNCPSPAIPTIASPQVPADVCVPQGFQGNPIQFFDDYSWRTFIAMIWPAANGERGHPDLAKNIDDSGPRVFETFKPVWEIFHTGPLR
jgi:hypothetical protein